MYPVTRVLIDKKAIKQIEKAPFYIKDKLYQWIDRVEIYGITYVREIKGFHDEPLKVDRFGQRSIRLNRSYRAIYEQAADENVIFITIIEVTNHEY